jgi:SPP1 family predicted phage head-tail adaptor
MSESRTEFKGGVYTTSWVSTSIEWANCQIYKDKETHMQQKKQQYNTWVCIMRAGTNVTNKNRLVLEDGEILTIEAVNNPTYRKRMIEVTCREEVI